jgi:hypothetical protein
MVSLISLAISSTKERKKNLPENLFQLERE